MSSSIPRSYKAFRYSKGPAPLFLEASQEYLPSSLSPYEVLIRIHAVALNYRDVARMDGTYPPPTTERAIPTSDCAAEVIAVGSEVTAFEPDDRVSPIFDLNNRTGTEDTKAALGAEADGVLRQYAVFDQSVLVHLPKHLSWEEAACITCAGTTAWNALEMPRSHGTALLQGTGGVSMFALLICFAAGIRPIITSSSDQKLEVVRSLNAPGDVETINYRTHPQWHEEARRLTGGRGVDIVVDGIGPAAATQNLAALARRGTLSLVGFLGGVKADRVPDVLGPTLAKGATVRGIYVGSKIDQEGLCKFLEQKKVSLQPILDPTVFSFNDAPAAFDYLRSAKHVGKVIIKL